MKRIPLLISFVFVSLFGTLCNAQTFVKKYTSYVTNVNNKISETKYATISVIFNDGDSTDIVVYATDEPKRFYRTGKITIGKTTVAGMGWRLFLPLAYTRCYQLARIINNKS